MQGEPPKIELQEIDAVATRVFINGFISPTIRNENRETLHESIGRALHYAFKKGYQQAERDSRQRVKALMDWANGS